MGEGTSSHAFESESSNSSVVPGIPATLPASTSSVHLPPPAHIGKSNLVSNQYLTKTSESVGFGPAQTFTYIDLTSDGNIVVVEYKIDASGAIDLTED